MTKKIYIDTVAMATDEELNTKANREDTYTKAEVDEQITKKAPDLTPYAKNDAVTELTEKVTTNATDIKSLKDKKFINHFSSDEEAQAYMKDNKDGIVIVDDTPAPSTNTESQPSTETPETADAKDQEKQAETETDNTQNN